MELVTAVAVPAALALLSAAVAWLVTGRRRRGRRRAQATDGALGLTVDLVAVVLGSGGTIRQAVAALATIGPDPVRPVFADILARSARGYPLTDALAEASIELGPGFHPLLGALLNAEVDGAPVGAVLTRLTDDLEQRDRWRADAAAGRLPILLLPPLVVCLLPAVVVGAVVPLAVVALRELGW